MEALAGFRARVGFPLPFRNRYIPLGMTLTNRFFPRIITVFVVIPESLHAVAGPPKIADLSVRVNRDSP